MPGYSRSFTFSEGDLGRNLATIDDKIHRFIKEDLDIAASRGELEMKAKAPWKNRTWDARNTLWADTDSRGQGDYKITMGHGVEYGIYLEKSNGGKFQIVMPVLVATARAFMESLEHMFEQLDNPAPVLPVITPGVGFDNGTSQGATEHGKQARGAAEKVASKVRQVRVYFRDAKGRFVSNKTPTTPKTRKTRRR